MFDFETLARLRGYLKVKHHIPGRIRISFDPRIVSLPEIRELTRYDGPLPAGVNGFRVNMAARSVVIEYDPARVPPDYLQELAVSEDDQQAAKIVKKIYELLK